MAANSCAVDGCNGVEEALIRCSTCSVQVHRSCAVKRFLAMGASVTRDMCPISYIKGAHIGLSPPVVLATTRVHEQENCVIEISDTEEEEEEDVEGLDEVASHQLTPDVNYGQIQGDARKRRVHTYTIATKIKAIRMVQSGMEASAVSKQLSIPSSTLNSWLVNADKYLTSKRSKKHKNATASGRKADWPCLDELYLHMRCIREKEKCAAKPKHILEWLTTNHRSWLDDYFRNKPYETARKSLMRKVQRFCQSHQSLKSIPLPAGNQQSLETNHSQPSFIASLPQSQEKPSNAATKHSQITSNIAIAASSVQSIAGNTLQQESQHQPMLSSSMASNLTMNRAISSASSSNLSASSDTASAKPFRRVHTYSIATKVDAIRMVQSGALQSNVARHFQVPSSTLSSWMEKAELYLNTNRSKKLKNAGSSGRKADWPCVEELLDFMRHVKQQQKKPATPKQLLVYLETHQREWLENYYLNKPREVADKALQRKIQRFCKVHSKI